MASLNSGEMTGARSEIIRLALDPSAKDLNEIAKDSTAASSPHALRSHLLASDRKTDAERLNLANVLASAVDEDVELAREILLDPKIKTTRSIAVQYGLHRIRSLVENAQQPADGVVAMSKRMSTSSAAERASKLATSFRRHLYAEEPTAVLQQMIASDDEAANPSENLPIHSSPEVRKGVANFLARRPGFNIRTASVITELEADDGGADATEPEFRKDVAESLKLLQRVQALAPAPEAIAPLLEMNLTSAAQLSSIPKKKFISAFSPRLAQNGASLDEVKVLATNIHEHAMASRLRADNALVQVHQALRGSGLRAIDGEGKLDPNSSELSRLMLSDSSGEQQPVNLDALFADMDMCECDACLDVTSPTAYFVELLQYLRNNNLDSDPKYGNTGQAGWTGTALEKLLIRRPDIQHLQLTCANANTVLPMIDLANEVMEAFTIHALEYDKTGKVTIETWNVDRETTGELLASPSHTRKKAYCILKEARYPIASLPYFQPLDASRLYLNYLGVSRFELIDTLRLGQSWAVRPSLVATPERVARYTQLRSQMQDRAAAAELLGIDPDEYVIITRESLWPIECSEFADTGTLIDVQTYLQSIGVAEPHTYWGYNSEVDVVSLDKDEKTGLSFVKAQFLRRSGFSFAETVQLLETKYVNPMMPTGKDKVLLDNIRYSYRFLQMITVGLTDKGERIDAISAMLFTTQAWVHSILSLQVVPTGNDAIPQSSRPTFTERDVKAWVRKWFDCIGKLIVLESDAGPRLPVEGYLVRIPPSDTRRNGEVSSTQSQQGEVLGYLGKTGQLRDQDSNIVGILWINGQLFYRGLKPIRETFPIERIALVEMPKQVNTPTVEELQNAASTGLYIEVDQQSYLTSYQSDHRWVVTWQFSQDNCSIENTLLLHLNGDAVKIDEWDRINRFIRLWRNLRSFDWTIPQLDAALVGLWKAPEVPPTVPDSPNEPDTPTSSQDAGFSFTDFKDKGCGCRGDDEDPCDDDDEDTSKSPCHPSNYIQITPGFLKELKSVQELSQLSGVELEKLLCLWSAIGTLGQKSLYTRLFLTHDLEALDPVFIPDDNGNYLASQPKIGDHVPVIISAIRIKADIFDAVLQAVGLSRESIITIPNLTLLYRHVLLSSILGIKPNVLLDALDLFPKPYESASATLELSRLWTRMSDASFTIKQLRYIILGLNDPLRPVGPEKIAILRTTKTITDGLLAIDVANPDLTEQEEAVLTVAQVKVKATLMFAPAIVESIVGLIEGTKLFTTNAPSGLAVDKDKASPKLIYKDLNGRATLSVTGSLTEEELNSSLALFAGNAAWTSALERLRRQTINLVKNNLGSVFTDDLDEAIQVLTQGDVAATLDASGVITDPGTTATKAVFFLRKFMPILRSYLHSSLITATMSGVASVAPDICTWLLTDVIKVASAGGHSSAMDVLISLKDSGSSAGSQSWTGFLLPPSTDTYVFYGFGDTQPAPLTLDGTPVPFTTQNEDPSNLWWTAPVRLQGGKTATLQVTGQAIPGDLQWKTSRSGITPIPPNCLIADSSLIQATAVFTPFTKASLVIRGFSLDLQESQHFQTFKSNFSDLDFGSVTLDAWKRLLDYVELRKMLPKREKRLLDVFRWANQKSEATADEISQNITAVTLWDINAVKLLLGRKYFDLGDVKLFRDERAISKLAKVFALTRKVGITDISLLASWTDLKLDFNPTWKMAKSIRQAIRAKYTASDYEQAIKPVHNTLRKNQRDALIAYLLIQPAVQRWGVTDADGLFEFFLLDVQMGSCMETSRTKQAISSIQLFVQRCILGLEEKYGVENDALDSERWEWMSKQTVWTANRKVFLYPENWLVPSLRDNKTPIYADMESEMLQREINQSTALESFRTYVTKLAEIARLRAVGIYIELVDGQLVLHCVAMTIGTPTLFFYRKCDQFNLPSREWTPWIRISIDIPVYTVPYDPTPEVIISLRAADPIFEPVVDTEGSKPISFFTGAYVVPVSWRSRTLVFIGEIVKKTVPNTDALATDFYDMNRPSADDNKITSADSAAAKETWEINVSWTEYRFGKWTQKKLAASACQTLATAPSKLANIDAFQFIPHILTSGEDEFVNVEVWRWADEPRPGGGGTVANTYLLGEYNFDGTVLEKAAPRENKPAKPTGWVPTLFQAIGGYRGLSFKVISLQRTDDGSALAYTDKTPYVAYNGADSNGIIQYTPVESDSDIFYHPFSSRLVTAAGRATEKTSIEPIENIYRLLPGSFPGFVDPAFGTGPSELSGDGKQHPTYAELSKPYTNYNWELGFHGPMQVADALLKSQQFDEALAMIHQVFNPYADGTDTTRVWQWYPFQQASSHRVLETILNQLKPRTHDIKITRWREKPFQPFVVARGRTVAYMKWTVMLYIKVLIAYGDMYFRRRSLEDIPLAIQLYVLASHLYGAKGETIPKRGKKVPQTYFSLADKWDAFGNALVQLEIAFPFSNQTSLPWGVVEAGVDPSTVEKDPKQIALANIFGFSSSSYFCLPSNPELKALRNTIDQRLYNIRHCLDIDGRPMPLALWDAPLDPGELVAAVASGLSVSSALNDLNSSLPNYRFTWLLARALETTAELKSLESNFLSIKEKRDSEALQILRNGHEITMHNMVMEIKKTQAEEANRSLIALHSSQESSKLRFDYFSRLAGVDVQPLESIKQPYIARNLDIDVPSGGDLHLNRTETEEQSESFQAKFWNTQAANLEVMAGIYHALPNFSVHGTPMGCGVAVTWGMPNMAAALSAMARQNQVYANDSTFNSTQVGRKANFIRQYQDRVHQMNLAGLEFNHINTQIDSQETRLKIANLDIANQQKIIDNATEVEDFLKNKYTNDDLYSYLENSTRTSLYQTYLLAYDLAKKAEQAFRFERRPTATQGLTDFISFGYFNAARDGTQASNQLYLALKSMDAAYQESRGHDYEITKSVSLRQLNPYALLTLRETGSCTFEVPEVSFDMDFPGHFFRRIKTVSLTVPCVVGPYVGVNATLRLLKHRYRADSLAASARDYVEDTESGQLDPRFRTAIVPIDAVATSSGQNDSGAFELSLKDERYAPFEGAGAISTWQIMLPPKEFPPFDYATISDVVLSVRYTSCEGGDVLRRAAAESVVKWIASVEGQSKEVGLLALWDVRAEFASEWAKLAVAGPNDGSEDIRTLVLKKLNARLPASVTSRESSKIRAKDVTLVTNLAFSQSADLALDFKYAPGGSGDSEMAFDSGPIKIGASLNMFRVSEADDPIGDWALKVKMSPDISLDSRSRMWIVTRYVLS